MRKIFLTVDTECHDIKKADQYIYGRKEKDLWGISKILELAEINKIPVNFFVDVGEAIEYGDKFIQDIVDEIHTHNQPVFFHLHPDYISGDKNRTFLWMYDYQEKQNIFDKAYNIYSKFAGENDRLVFRAGRYGVDYEMIDILKHFDKQVLDLSYVYDAPKMCHLSNKDLKTKNRAVKIDNVIILPTTRFVGFDYFGIKRCIGLDSADATYNEFKRFIDNTKLSNIVYTMHSWNFIRKWFFASHFFLGDRSMVRKFEKSVKYAQKRGFEFCDLRNYEYIPEEDEVINMCSGIKGKVLGIFNNYFRFKKIARLNKRYFLLYSVFYVICLVLICLMLYFCVRK